MAEMICDNLAAGIVYKGKDWNKEYQLTYWNKTKDKIKINPKLYDMLTEVYERISIEGIDAVVNQKILKSLYDKHIK